MLKLVRNRHGVDIIDCWYANEPLNEKGILNYHEAVKPMGKKNVPFETLISDISVSEEDMVALFSKNCKYKVNRAPREGVTVQCMEKDEVTDTVIREFVDFYAAFYESKGYAPVDKEHLFKEMARYRNNDALSIHVAYIENNPVVYHTHILADEYARLYHSASLYRVIEGINHNVVGMANRYLHKVDMLKFKEMGFLKYDWGGAGTDEEVAKITEFKESFGGTRVTYYTCSHVRGIKARLYRFVTGLL